MVAKASAKPITKEGTEYLQLDKVIAKVRIGNGQIAFDETERPLAGEYNTVIF